VFPPGEQTDRWVPVACPSVALLGALES
jgi:hypothetical protein